MKILQFRPDWKQSSCALGLLVALCTVNTLPAAAGSVAQLRQRQQSVVGKQSRLMEEFQQADLVKTGLLGKISSLDSSRNEIESEVRSLNTDIAALDSRIAATHDALRASNVRLARLTGQLQAILRRLDARTRAFTARAVAAYEAGPTNGLDSLLSSQSFGDLVSGYTYYQSALSADVTLMDQIQDLRAQTQGHRAAVESQQAVVLAARDKLETARGTVARHRNKKRSALASLKILIAKKHSAVARIKSRKGQLKLAIAENARESARIGSLLQASTFGGAATGDGQLLWPASGPITSSFGWRIHPIFGASEFHAGIDIGAPYGSTVSAADAGTVEFAGTMTGYGNVLVIDHGGGLATLYGHLSAYGVSAGQAVERGAPVANVGCTGYCTGPHLHFEVRLSGTPVDPIPYLQ
jgi:murein DD-endopeptidase MepM/ murein hydrolase activator NlpD